MYIQVEFWHWWVLALCFVVFEGMIPSGVFVAMGIAAGALGAIVMGTPYLEVTVQLGIFGSITMILTLIIAKYKRKQYLDSLERGDIDAEYMVGKEFELTMPIQNGFGEVQLDGQHWSLKGPTTKRGTLVRVLQLDGDMLMVMPVDIINEYKKANEEKSS